LPNAHSINTSLPQLDQRNRPIATEHNERRAYSLSLSLYLVLQRFWSPRTRLNTQQTSETAKASQF